MRPAWRTAWQGQDIVVFRNEVEFDRLHAADILRIVLIYRGNGETPGDVAQVVVESAEDCLLIPPNTGFAGRVNFERQAYWAERGCVYWVPESRAPLPLRHRRGWWLFGLAPPTFRRVPRSDLAAAIDRWPLQGPQTWEQRKWRRIERSRPFAAPSDDDAGLRA